MRRPIAALFGLRSDPFERGEESIFYNSWFIEHVPLQYAAQAIVHECLESFREFPRARAGGERNLAAPRSHPSRNVQSRRFYVSRAAPPPAAIIRRMTRARLFIPALAFVTFSGATPMAQHWPHWRGPTHDGVSLETNLPVSWGAECKPQAAEPAPTSGSSDQGAGLQPQGRGRGRGQPAEGRPLVSIACRDFDTKNVAWKLPLPAYSGSTPIIWGNTIFLNVATATNTGSIELWAIDRNKPEVKWKRLLVDANNMQRKQNMSSPSPVTDGKHVWVMTGFGVFKAFDFDGKEIWSRDLQADYGKFGLNHGYASSPLLRPDGLYVQVLHGMKTDDPVVHPQDRQDDGQDGVARRKADAGCQRISRLLHDAGVGRGQRPRRADHHGR